MLPDTRNQYCLHNQLWEIKAVINIFGIMVDLHESY